MKKVNKITTLLLIAAFVFYMMMPFAYAAGEYSIKIKGSNDTHTYGAWQIFSGVVSDGTLSDIQWGSGINDSGALLSALQSDELIGDDFTSATDAKSVAKVLETYKEAEAEKIRQFAEVVSGHLNEEATGTSTFAESYHTISGLNAGYYFIKDTKAIEDNNAATKYMLKVTTDTEMDVKAGVPTVEKKVARENSEDFHDAVSAETGSKVTFKLSGTLPDNYSDYKSYHYSFVDTLPAGLKYVSDSVKLTIEGHEIEQGKYTISNNTDDNKLTITITDLVGLDKELLDFEITKDSTVVVTYDATIEVGAVIGNDGNTNKVVLEYSSNPNKGGETEYKNTTEDTASVFAYQLDIEKQDSKNSDKLSGVEFKLYKKIEETDWYAVVEGDVIKSWTQVEADASTLTTNDNGKISIKGLQEGTYYLKETKPKAGYDNISDLTLKIEDTLSEDGAVKQEITGLTIQVDEDDAVSGAPATGIVSIIVKNVKGSLLPSTGGIGTIIFYASGIGVLTLSIVLIAKKKQIN